MLGEWETGVGQMKRRVHAVSKFECMQGSEPEAFGPLGHSC